MLLCVRLYALRARTSHCWRSSTQTPMLMLLSRYAGRSPFLAPELGLGVPHIQLAHQLSMFVGGLSVAVQAQGPSRDTDMMQLAQHQNVLFTQPMRIISNQTLHISEVLQVIHPTLMCPTGDGSIASASGGEQCLHACIDAVELHRHVPYCSRPREFEFEFKSEDRPSRSAAAARCA